MKLIARVLLLIVLFVGVGISYYSFTDKGNLTEILKKHDTFNTVFETSKPAKVSTDYRVFAIIHLANDVVLGFRQEIVPTNNSPPSLGLISKGTNAAT